MDQGVAAVLGAGVGVLGALGTAVLTYVGLRHQTASTAANQHRQTVRTERVEAFSAFIEAVQSADSSLMDAHIMLDGISEVEDETERLEDAESALEHVEAAKEAMAVARKCYAKILILGPQGLVGSSHEVLQLTHSRISSLSRAAPSMINSTGHPNAWLEQYDSQSQLWGGRLGTFTARAAHVLEGRELPA